MLPERVAIPIRVLGLGTPQREKKLRTAIRPRSTKVSYAGCTEKSELEVRQPRGHNMQLSLPCCMLVARRCSRKRGRVPKVRPPRQRSRHAPVFSADCRLWPTQHAIDCSSRSRKLDRKRAVDPDRRPSRRPQRRVGLRPSPTCTGTARRPRTGAHLNIQHGGLHATYKLTLALRLAGQTG
jgi:hypothetical protein